MNTDQMLHALTVQVERLRRERDEARAEAKQIHDELARARTVERADLIERLNRLERVVEAARAAAENWIDFHQSSRTSTSILAAMSPRIDDLRAALAALEER